MRKVKFLSKVMALVYLFHEFGNRNLKVTTILDDEGIWQGKVILESTTEEAKDDLEFAKFYADAFVKEHENNK